MANEAVRVFFFLTSEKLTSEIKHNYYYQFYYLELTNEPAGLDPDGPSRCDILEDTLLPSLYPLEYAGQLWQPAVGGVDAGPVPQNL